MKIKEIKFSNFKRFTNLTIRNIPETAKLVVLVGPNGCGKSSLLEAFNFWYKTVGFGYGYDSHNRYYIKKGDAFGLLPVIEFHKNNLAGCGWGKGKFYFRTAFRNEPSFVISKLSKQNVPTENIDHETLMITDSNMVSSNYQRLVSKTLSGVYDDNNDEKKVQELKNEIIGNIQNSLKNVFPDLELSSIGDPLTNGSFYFTKGVATDFAYENLSAGEKAAFDLILDLIIKSEYYTDTIFCIDEPEIHMHTTLQSNLLGELYSLIQENSQLWISTHSIGMLKKAKELEEQNPGTVIFLDFDNKDFDSEVVITPTEIDRTMWKRFLDLAFGDLSTLVAPKTIVFCEGDPKGIKNKDFDAQIYTKIFSEDYPDVCFASIGSCTEIEKEDNMGMKIISNVLNGSTTIKIVDRDYRSETEIEELKCKKIRVLSKRHIESYLFDDEVMKLLCEKENKPDKYDEILSVKVEKLKNSVSKGKAPDDIKSARGEIYVEIRKILQLTQCGNTVDAFCRDTLAPLITPKTNVYKQLKKDIFGE